MNVTRSTDKNVIRHIVQNVTEHFQEDEKDSFLLAYALIALVICLIISSIISNKWNWFPSNALYMVMGYFLQEMIVYKLSSKYNKPNETNFSQYSSLLNLCFFPLQMFQSGFALDAPLFLSSMKSVTVLSICSSLLFIFLFTFLLSNLSEVIGLRSLNLWNTLAFAAAMCATDSSFLTPFLTTCGCSDQIISILEGNDILSEVISILLFRTIVELQINVVNKVLIIEGINYFLSFMIFSFGIGIFTGFCSSFVFKWIDSNRKGIHVLEVTLFFCIPIITYMLAEGMHVSSSIAIRICGFIMACYTQYNVNNETKVVDLTGYLSETCSYLVIGMISYNYQPFYVNWKWLVLTIFVIYISQYAAITGVMNTLLKWAPNPNRLRNHKSIFVLYFVYRGSLSFILTSRGEGELLDTNQVVLMMRLSLCMIWFSVIQHLILVCPFTGFSVINKKAFEEDSEEIKKNEDNSVGSNCAIQTIQEWLSWLLIKKKTDDMEHLLNTSYILVCI